MENVSRARAHTRTEYQNSDKGCARPCNASHLYYTTIPRPMTPSKMHTNANTHIHTPPSSTLTVISLTRISCTYPSRVSSCRQNTLCASSLTRTVPSEHEITSLPAREASANQGGRKISVSSVEIAGWPCRGGERTSVRLTGSDVGLANRNRNVPCRSEYSVDSGIPAVRSAYGRFIVYELDTTLWRGQTHHDSLDQPTALVQFCALCIPPRPLVQSLFREPAEILKVPVVPKDVVVPRVIIPQTVGKSATSSLGLQEKLT